MSFSYLMKRWSRALTCRPSGQELRSGRGGQAGARRGGVTRGGEGVGGVERVEEIEGEDKRKAEGRTRMDGWMNEWCFFCVSLVRRCHSKPSKR